MMKAKHIVALICAALSASSFAIAQTYGSEQAFASIREMLKSKQYDSVRDSVNAAAVIDVLDKTPWTTSDLYILGAQILDKDPGSFAGRYLKGWYLSHTATDKLGYRKALEELRLALSLWDTQAFPPYHGSMDALLASQTALNVPERERTVHFLMTYYYLQLQYELSSVYLELDMPAESYALMKQLRDDRFAYDFYSMTRMAWIFYKYRDAAAERKLQFLKPSGTANITEAIRLAKQQQREIGLYVNAKYSFPRYWMDSYTTTWYENAANNIISIAYGVGWQIDSSITYYEKMPEWFKLRLNGTYLYLSDVNYRAAERQFEYAGKPGGVPVAVLSDPEALEAYKNILIYKGALDEAHTYLDDYAEKYKQWRGMGMLWEGTMLYWNGNLDEAERMLKRAYDYPEVFGNTSFTRQHYDMQIHIQLSAVHKAKIRRLEFEPVLETVWYKQALIGIKNFFLKLYHWIMAYLHEYWAVDAYLQIVDREQYIKVFYTENPADYYQTWSILKNLNPDWHLKRLAEAKRRDERIRAKKFYDLFRAGFLLEKGDNREALSVITGNALTAKADTAYEKLFIAMAEDMTIRAQADGSRKEEHVLNIYRWYPQAVYLWGYTLPLTVRYKPTATLRTEADEYLEEMRDKLEQFDFDFTPARTGVPVLTIEPAASEAGFDIRYAVKFDGGIRNIGTITVTMDKEGAPNLPSVLAAKQLAYSVLNIRFHTEEKTHANTLARGS